MTPDRDRLLRLVDGFAGRKIKQRVAAFADDAAHGIRLGAWRDELAVGGADDLGGDGAL